VLARAFGHGCDGSEPGFTRFEPGYDPADPVDQTLLRAGQLFPEHGLVPLPLVCPYRMSPQA
jgi:hypothetical protein